MKENCSALTIAGSDSGGGAGIQADLKTFSALGVFGTSVITAVTAQNLEGVTGVQGIDADIIDKQMRAVLKGFPVKAIKTGMLFSSEIIGVIAGILSQYRHIPLVIDPVFVATSGSKLIQDIAIEKLKVQLFPLATLITPNIPEAEVLLNKKIHHTDQLEQIAQNLFNSFHVPVLLKGGHVDEYEEKGPSAGRKMARDFFVDKRGSQQYQSEWINGINTHGSGCTLASAIAAALAKGESLKTAVKTAKSYITDALKNSLPLTKDLRVINHFPIEF